ncbi:unnamed protein product [Sympodiomycopsis kandeliae]
MINRNGSGVTGNAAAPRQPTPASPSPSPEPSASNATTNDTSFNNSSHVKLEALDAADQELSALKGEVPFHQVLKLAENDPSDIYRQEAEDQILKVIDSLYEVAVHAADVQPGSEHLVGSKVNATISNLSTLFNTSQQHSSNDSNLLPLVPEEVLEAIDEGRNPDTWSKNRLARLVSDNQQLAGQRWAMEKYRKELSSQVRNVFPELEEVLQQMDVEHRGLRTRSDEQGQDGGMVGREVKMEQ